MTDGTPPVAVALCDGTHGDARLDPLTVVGFLADTVPGIPVEIVDDLCGRPEQIRDLVRATGATRLVLGFCDRTFPRGEAQAWSRKAGLDPFAVELVSLAFAAGSAVAAGKILAAAVAAARSFNGSEPEHLRTRFSDGPTSRRALFRLPPITYEPAAAVDANLCLGADRCGLCATACPVGAITLEDRTIVDNRACVACGLCVSACPARAITLPNASLDRYEAQVASLLSPTADGRPRGLVLACERTASALDGLGAAESWLTLELPCIGMITPGWVLQALAAGAPAVALLPCRQECHPERTDPLDERVGYCREVLELAGIEEAASLVRVLDPADPGPLLEAVLAARVRGAADSTVVILSEPAATADALLKLAGARAHRTPSLERPGSPLGVVRIDHLACTACGACATTCPTGALTVAADEHETALNLDPGACLACERCVPACPERAVTVRRETDIAALARGPVVVKMDHVHGCVRCGRPVAPAAMLRRIRGLLADEPDALIRDLTELCGDCRAVSTHA
ncbi:MAG: 4Fe-4S binding protein [Actinomycetota bacterium]